MNHLRIKVERISLESFSGADIRNLLANAIPSAIADVKDFFNKFTAAAPAVSLGFNQQSFVREVSKHPYLDIAPLTAFVPEGMDVTYLEYANVLEPAVEHATNILSGIMASYSVFLSQLISNSDFKHSTHSFEKIYKDLAKERETFNKDIGHCFNKGSTKTEVSLGDVIKRNADWPLVISHTDNMLKLINSVDHKVLNRKIAECSDLLDIILEKIKRDEFVGMSPEIIANLADGAFQVASELEFYSVMHYRVTALSIAVTRTVEHFEKIMKK